VRSRSLTNSRASLRSWAGSRHDRGLGDLEHEHRRRDVVAPQHRGDVLDERRVVQLARRQVHRQRRRVVAVRAPPAGRLGARGVEHPAADLDDEAALLGARDELVGPDHPALGMLPAHERLDRDGAPVAQVDDRLEVDDELVAGDRALQVARQLAALQRLGLHLRREERVSAALALGRVHRQVGLAHEVLERRGVVGRDRDARRRGQLDGLALELEAAPERVERPLRGVRRTVRRIDRLQQDRELVPAQADDEVALAHRLLQAPGRLAQQLVTGRVAERVVDELEVVEVDEQQADGAAGAPAPGQRGRGPVGELRTVRQAGQRVDPRVLEPLLDEMVGLRAQQHHEHACRRDPAGHEHPVLHPRRLVREAEQDAAVEQRHEAEVRREPRARKEVPRVRGDPDEEDRVEAAAATAERDDTDDERRPEREQRAEGGERDRRAAREQQPGGDDRDARARGGPADRLAPREHARGEHEQRTAGEQVAESARRPQRGLLQAERTHTRGRRRGSPHPYH
jgi:hypothetical protein